MSEIINLETLEVVGVAAVDSDALEFVTGHSSIEAAWDQCKRSDWMLWMLESAATERILTVLPNSHLRAFACWCARVSAGAGKTSGLCALVLEAAEAYAAGLVGLDSLQSAQKDAIEQATGAAVVGLPKQLSSAAAQLACFHAGNQHALFAARWSSWFHVRTARNWAAEMGVAKLKWPGTLPQFVELNWEVLEGVEAGAWAGQADELRSLGENPFAGMLLEKRWPRNDLGFPLLPDLAMPLSGQLVRVPPSEKQRLINCRPVDSVQDESIRARIRDYFLARKQADGEERARVEWRALYNAVRSATDYNASIDDVYLRTYEDVAMELFPSKSASVKPH